MKRVSTDIFISGGGVAGLTAAAAFGTAGFNVLIVDPVPPVTVGDVEHADLRTTAFLQPARNFLIRAGLWERLSPFSTPLQIMRIVDASQDAPIVRSFDAADISDEPFGWNLPNWLLRREMIARLEELPNVEFRSGVGFETMLTRTESALVKLSDGSSINAKLIVGADGRGSVVRAAAGIDTKTTRYGQRALTFAVCHDQPHQNISTEVHMSGGPFTLVPLPDHKGRPCSAVVWMSNSAEVEKISKLDTDAFNSAATDRSAGVLGQLTCVSRRTMWPIISQLANAMSAERVALIAEAAHVMPPIGAQGLNMSLSDLACLIDLAEVHRDKLGSRKMLDNYQSARHNDVRLRVKGIDLLNRASIAGNPLLQDLRSWGMKALHDVDPIRKQVMQMGLGAKS